MLSNELFKAQAHLRKNLIFVLFYVIKRTFTLKKIIFFFSPTWKITLLNSGSERLNKTQYEKVRRDTQKTLIQNIGSLLPIAAGNNLDQITILRLTHAYLSKSFLYQNNYIIFNN